MSTNWAGEGGPPLAGKTDPRPVAQILAEAMQHAQRLIQLEMQFAKATVYQEIRTALSTAGWAAGAFISAFFALAFLLLALFLYLSARIAGESAALWIAAPLALIAIGMFSVIRSKFSNTEQGENP